MQAFRAYDDGTANHSTRAALLGLNSQASTDSPNFAPGLESSAIDLTQSLENPNAENDIDYEENSETGWHNQANDQDGETGIISIERSDGVSNGDKGEQEARSDHYESDEGKDEGDIESVASVFSVESLASVVSPSLDGSEDYSDRTDDITSHHHYWSSQQPEAGGERPRATRENKILKWFRANAETWNEKASDAFKQDFYNAITISDDQSTDSRIEERKLLVLREPYKDKPSKSRRIFHEPDFISTENPLRPSPYSPETRSDFGLEPTLKQQKDKIKHLTSQRKQTRMNFESSSAKEGPIAPQAIATAAEMPSSFGAPAIEQDLQKVLGVADSSNLDLQKLQEYIGLLQAKAQRFEATQEKEKPPRYQILHRLLQKEITQHIKPSKTIENSYSMPFFDPPEWIQGQGDARRIRCNLPLHNFDLYLENNKDVSFLVYRYFDTESASIVAEPGIDDSTDRSALHLPQYTKETIRPVNKDLIDAIEALLNSRGEYTGLLRHYAASSELSAPYLFIYHSRKGLADFQETLPLPARAQLSLLAGYVTEQYAKEYQTADSSLSQNKISPEHIQYLFKPGDVLLERVKDEYVGYVSTSWPKISSKTTVSQGRGTTVPLYDFQDAARSLGNDRVNVYVCDIDAWNWDFDGNFQRRNAALSLNIPDVSDTKNTNRSVGENSKATKGGQHKVISNETNIADLNIIPLEYASPEIVAKCRRRGKIFWKCRTRSYISYQDNEIESIQNLTDERYMVDLKTYRNLHGKYNSISNLTDGLGPEAMLRDEPPDEQFELLLPLLIKGYNLRRKKWVDLSADRISDVKWNKEAFQSLVIDRKARDLITALVSNHLAAEKGTDLIMGKGNGLILLLHGGPGTGKTLTAESVAEIAEKPLYRVTCGDVGTKAEDVEKYLESVLYLGKIWGCVVLLDEADVFLEQRSLNDMARNALVSVFLRVLEYYEGILVLTSNRVGTFDEAFKSRIQLALHYPNLGPYQRLRIWENFINRLESFGNEINVDIPDLRDHLENLKEEEMNGRQIRNAITTARQYADWKKTTLTYEHLRDVIEVSGRFDKYINGLHGGFSQDEIAEDGGLRLANGTS